MPSETATGSPAQAPAATGSPAQAPAATGNPAQVPRVTGSPAHAHAAPARPGHTRLRNLLLASVLLLPIAGMAALLIIFHPFATAAGGCGGG